MGRAPAALLYANSKSVVIYPASLISLPAGSDITRLYFKGYTATSRTDYDAHIKVYLQNTDEAPFINNGESSKTDLQVDTTTHMTKVYDGTLRIVHGVGSASNAAIVLDLPLDSKFKYDGRNLRMTVIYSSVNGSSSMDVHYVSDTRFDKAAYIAQSDASLDAAKTWYQRTMPVAFFEAERGQKFSGTVKNTDGNAVAGATVTLKSGDVVYTTQTDVTGSFEVLVIQDDKTYTTEISAVGYLTDSSQQTFSNGPVSYAAVLAVDPSTSIKRIGDAFTSKTVDVYDVNGRLLRRIDDTKVPKSLPAGIYIIKGKKVIVK